MDYYACLIKRHDHPGDANLGAWLFTVVSSQHRDAQCHSLRSNMHMVRIRGSKQSDEL